MTAAKRREHRLFGIDGAAASRQTLARALRKYRARHGLTQIELADRIGCSKMQICHLEAADNDPSHALYLAVCRVLQAGRPPLT